MLCGGEGGASGGTLEASDAPKRAFDLLLDRGGVRVFLPSPPCLLPPEGSLFPKTCTVAVLFLPLEDVEDDRSLVLSPCPRQQQRQQQVKKRLMHSMMIGTICSGIS